MVMDTTIKVTKDFKKWLASNCDKSQSYQEVIIKIINELPPEKLEAYLKKGCYSYSETARLLGIQIKK